MPVLPSLLYSDLLDKDWKWDLGKRKRVKLGNWLRNNVLKEVMITVVPLLILNVNIHEPLFGYLWTSFSSRVSNKSPVFQ